MSSAMIDLTMHPSSDASKVRRSRLTLSILDQSSTVSLLEDCHFWEQSPLSLFVHSINYMHSEYPNSPNMIFGYIPTIDVLPPLSVGSIR
jgi:hypothetical protein